MKLSEYISTTCKVAETLQIKELHFNIPVLVMDDGTLEVDNNGYSTNTIEFEVRLKKNESRKKK